MRLLPLMLIGCGGTWGFGGQELGDANTDPNDTAAEQDYAGPRAGGVDASCADTGSDGSRVDAWSDSAGTVEVSHHGYEWDCCAEWEVSVTEEGASLLVAYDDVDDMECDCSCPWSLAYTLTDVPAGEWTVEVPGGDTATVTVE